MRYTTALTIIGMIGLTCGPVFGQHRIEQGNVLDANMRLGSGGLNQARPAYDFNAGNRIMTGNVIGGRSFQGYSPIRNPNSLYLGTSSVNVPSSSLSNFQRDSFNLADYRRRSLSRNPTNAYYAPSSTVLNTGAILAGQNRPGTSQVKDSYEVLQTYRQGAGAGAVSPLTGAAQGGNMLSVPTQLIRATTGQPVSGQVNQRLLQSRLFTGMYRAVSVNELAGQAQQDGQMGSTVGRTAVTGPLDTRVTTAQDLRVQAGQQPPQPARLTGSPLDRVFARAQGEVELPAETPGMPSTGGQGGSLTGAGNLYIRMRELSQQMMPESALARPIGPVAGEAAEAGAPPKAETTPVAGAVAAGIAGGSIEIMPIKTFVGTEESAINTRLAYAETMLKAGRYYRAAEAYDLARAIDPRNPLPSLGKGMALLAAGDYVSSTSSLFGAIENFESLSLFRLDFESFLPDLKVLDRRRADLERQLELRDDYRLRFLLGYAEYCSGLRELGLANLDRAVQQMDEKGEASPAVVRFVQNLKAPLAATQPAANSTVK